MLSTPLVVMESESFKLSTPLFVDVDIFTRLAVMAMDSRR